MKSFFVFLVSCLAFAANDTAIHPVPKKPVFLNESLYASLKNELPALPRAGSSAQATDEKLLFSLQKSRTDADCARAKTEVFVALGSFFGGPQSPLSPADIEKLTPFFEQIRNDADFFIQKLKKDFPRKRPFLYLKGLTPCVPKEVTGAYPSGHAVLAKLFALVMTDLFPKQGAYFEHRAGEISLDRVLSGMHHPSDIEAGAKLGGSVYRELQKSTTYKSELEKARKAIAAPPA